MQHIKVIGTTGRHAKLADKLGRHYTETLILICKEDNNS